MILSITLWVLIGIATAYVAFKRGRDPFAWFAIGILFGLLGLLLLMILAPVTPETEEEKNANPLQSIPVDSPEVIALQHYHLINEWFCVDKARQQQGPMRFDVLKDLWGDNGIDAASFVWCEGMAEWKRISDLPELYSALKESKDESHDSVFPHLEQP